MKLSDIVLKQGIEKSEQKPNASALSAPRRRYFWDEEENQTATPKEAVTPKGNVPEVELLKFQKPVSSPLDKNTKESNAASQALASHLVASSSAVESEVTCRESAVSSPLGKEHKKSKPVSQPLATALEVRELGVRENKNSPLDIGLLVGKEKNLVLLACDECRKIGSLETNYISTDDLKIKLSIDSNGLRNLIHRVKEKDFFGVEAKQLGRNGLRKFKISQTIYQQFLNLPLDSRESAASQAVAQPLGTPLDEAPCSSSSLNINNISTTEEPIWLNIPERLHGQLPINQLRIMVRTGVVTQEVMEDSLWGFAHDLDKGLVRSKTGNTTGLFIGALKNGGYISQKYLEMKQKEVQELRAQTEELKQLLESIESSRLSEEFESFRSNYPEQAEKMKPISSYLSNFETGSVGYKMWLEEYKKSLIEESINNPGVPNP